MKRVELGIDIAARSSDIWSKLTDPGRFPEWIKGIKDVQMLSQDPYGVGTRYRVTAGSGNRSVEWTVVITSLVSLRRIDFSYSGDVEGSGGWIIEELEGGERHMVTSFDEFEPPGGWLVKLLSRLWLDNAARSSRRESLQRLKEILEDE